MSELGTIKRVRIELEMEGLDPLHLDYRSGERFEIRATLMQSKQFAQLFRSLDINERGMVVDTGQRTLELKLDMEDREQQARYEEAKKGTIETKLLDPVVR